MKRRKIITWHRRWGTRGNQKYFSSLVGWLKCYVQTVVGYTFVVILFYRRLQLVGGTLIKKIYLPMLWRLLLSCPSTETGSGWDHSDRQEIILWSWTKKKKKNEERIKLNNCKAESAMDQLAMIGRFFRFIFALSPRLYYYYNSGCCRFYY